MNQFVRCLFLVSAIFSFNLNFVKAEPGIINYVVNFLKTGGSIQLKTIEEQLIKYEQQQSTNMMAELKIAIVKRKKRTVEIQCSPDNIKYLAGKILEKINKSYLKSIVARLNNLIKSMDTTRTKTTSRPLKEMLPNSFSLMQSILQFAKEGKIGITTQKKSTAPNVKKAVAEEAIAKSIANVCSSANFQNINLDSIENQINKYYQENSETDQDELKNLLAVRVRSKLFALNLEQITERINFVKDQENLHAILEQLIINEENGQQIEDDLGNRGFIIPISPTCAFVILSIAGTSFYYYYLSTHSQDELFEQISYLWNWMQNRLGFLG